MTRRIAFASLLLACFAVPANAQKDTPQSTSQLSWETVAKVEANRQTSRAKIDGGWLYMVQVSNGVALTFVPDESTVAPKNKKGKKPKKAEKGAPATDLEAVKKEAQALRDQAERAKLVAEESRKEAEVARQEALAQREKAEVVAARAADEAAKAKAEARKFQAELEQARREAERLKRLLDSKGK